MLNYFDRRQPSATKQSTAVGIVINATAADPRNARKLNAARLLTGPQGPQPLFAETAKAAAAAELATKPIFRKNVERGDWDM
jgi:hypothetical protein